MFYPPFNQPQKLQPLGFLQRFLTSLPLVSLTVGVLGSLSPLISGAQAVPPRTFTDWCLSQESATPGQQKVIQLLQELSRKADCKAADQHLRHRKALTINGLKLTDVQVFTALPQLTHLNVENNAIADWQPLTQLPNLESLNLRDNQISDVSPINAMPSLTRIDLSGNPIEDFESLVAIADRIKIRAQRPRQSLLVPPSLREDPRPGFQLGQINGVDRRVFKLTPDQPAQAFEFQVKSGDLQVSLDRHSSPNLAIALYQKVEDSPMPWLPVTFPQLSSYGEQTMNYPDLEAGTYHLFVQQEPNHPDTTFFSFVLLHGLPTPQQEPDTTRETPATIHQLKPLSPPHSSWYFQGVVHPHSNPRDTWQFTLDHPNQFGLFLQAKQGSAIIELYDEADRPVALNNQLGDKNSLQTLPRDGVAGISTDQLEPGTYRLQIRPAATESQVPYQVVLTKNSVHPNP